MLVYSSLNKDDTLLGKFIDHPQPEPTPKASNLSISDQRSTLLFNRFIALTALVSLNAITYFAAHAVISA